MLLMDLIHLSNKDLWKILWSVKFFKVNFLHSFLFYMMQQIDSSRLIEQKLTFIINKVLQHLMKTINKRLLIKDMRLNNVKKKILKQIMVWTCILIIMVSLGNHYYFIVLMIQIIHYTYSEIEKVNNIKRIQLIW